uniref:ATP-citrate synthase n=1 Tax=Hordeum vulgare subsp. vulgare TaxID=112509 RepID=F2E4I2_HORVV|nr:predicted protein [Hordeum vulgare subsp. vulgare]
MSQKAIREFDGKLLMSRWLKANSDFVLPGVVQIKADTVIPDLPARHDWLLESKLVVKPDQLIKRRGKAGLIKLNASLNDVMEWVNQRMNKEVQVEQVAGLLDHFIVEPFIPHKPTDEYYICINSQRTGDEILFYHEGGVDVGDVDAKALRLLVPIMSSPSIEDISTKLLAQVPKARVARLALFISKLFEMYAKLHFAYLEINPLVMLDDLSVIPLDLAAKLDETAKFECSKHWGSIEFPAAFGRPPSPEEAYIQELDSSTGASLKLTVLNPNGRIWTMIAGGGASVIYADTIVDLGGGAELANYGEYSGAPSESATYEYAKTILKLMTKVKRDDGKILIIGGGIANFTNVADTFKGIIRALTEFADTIRAHGIKIFVRRGGPNYQEGLNMMRQLAVDLDLPIVVHGPERHMTTVVSLALGKSVAETEVTPPASPPSLSKRLSTDLSSIPSRIKSLADEKAKVERERSGSSAAVPAPSPSPPAVEQKVISKPIFSSTTRSIVYGLQIEAVQNMLDFDYICERKTPSVACMVYPFSGNHFQKFYWNTKEILVPIYQHLDEAIKKNPDVDSVVNFASSRSVYESTLDLLKHPQLRTIAIIAEGVPERYTRDIIRRANATGVMIIGPATVGGIKPGCFRVGNTGGMLDNILSSKLYRPGSVAYVARSGGMSNELNNIVSRNTDGVYEGVAIGGDMYPGSTFIDHMLRYEQDPDVKMIVLLGEVGGVEEYRVCEAIKSKRITKPVVAWCIGTCAKMFPYEVQFGHAGACAAGKDITTADAKNRALKLAGCVVPDSFNHFGMAIKNTYKKLVKQGVIMPRPESEPPQIPVDYSWARKLGLIRKPANFISTISDERGDELVYGNMPISDIFAQSMGIGGVVGLLWFRRRLPDYFCQFIEMVLMLTADHGPAVAGAHNTIVTARAGKDLVSSLVSGLLTIGPRFGGALDGAAEQFTWGYDSGLSPEEFVSAMRKKNELILGIGHKVKSLDNPDSRVAMLKKFIKDNFKGTEVFDYACQVERITTKKKANLILNVDGCVGVAFVDLLRSCGAFTKEEANDYIKMGVLNGLFVVGRSIGFVGHFIDQKRLKQGLYRHPTEDISYITDENLSF